jgi:hypothetical protein
MSTTPLEKFPAINASPAAVVAMVTTFRIGEIVVVLPTPRERRGEADDVLLKDRLAILRIDDDKIQFVERVAQSVAFAPEDRDSSALSLSAWQMAAGGAGIAAGIAGDPISGYGSAELVVSRVRSLCQGSKSERPLAYCRRPPRLKIVGRHPD